MPGAGGAIKFTRFMDRQRTTALTASRFEPLRGPFTQSPVSRDFPRNEGCKVPRRKGEELISVHVSFQPGDDFFVANRFVSLYSVHGL